MSRPSEDMAHRVVESARSFAFACRKIAAAAHSAQTVIPETAEGYLIRDMVKTSALADAASAELELFRWVELLERAEKQEME